MDHQVGEMASGHAPIDHASLPIVPAGAPLIEHEVYLDIANPGSGPCVALHGQTAASGNSYVAQRDVSPEVWDQLIREDGEARLHKEAEAPHTVDASPTTAH